MANFFDQFVAPAPAPAQEPAQGGSAPNWFQQFTVPPAPSDAGPSAGDVAADFVKGTAIGPVKGTIGMAGTGDFGKLLSGGIEKLIDFIAPDKPAAERQQLIDHFNDRLGLYSPFSPDMPTSAGIRKNVEKVTGPLYDAKYLPGRVGESVGEFLPAAAMGPGGATRRIVGGAVIPGAASELAGEGVAAVAGPEAGSYAKLAAALFTGTINAALVRPETAVAALKQNLPPGFTEQMVDKANELMQQRLVPTWAEALSQAAGRPILLDQQRMLENARQSRNIMSDFMAKRPEQVKQAVTEQMDRIAPPTEAPQMIGPAASEAATGTINDVRAAINRATKPMYEASGQTLVPPDVHAAMIAKNPVFEEALNFVRKDPAWRAQLGVQSDRSINVYDAVKQELEERARRLANPTNPEASAFQSASAGNAAAEARAAAIEADKIATGGPSSYEAALKKQAELRQQHLAPLQHGPLGQIADAPETKRAIAALFPKDATSVSPAGITDAVKGVARNNPQAAEQLVRAHVEKALNDAFSSAGRSQEAAQAAGANFAENVAGNPAVKGPQLENFRAAIEALPGREGIWPGIQRMLEVAQATGWRMPKGSPTAYAIRDLEGASTGGVIANIVKHGAHPFGWPELIQHAVGRWQLGTNLDQMARIMTDPKSVQIFRTIAKMPADSPRTQALVARLIAQSGASSDTRKPEGQ